MGFSNNYSEARESTFDTKPEGEYEVIIKDIKEYAYKNSEGESKSRLAVKLLAELPSSRLPLQQWSVRGERIADNGVDQCLAAAVTGRDRHDGVPLARIVPMLLKVLLHRMAVDDLRDMRPRLSDDCERFLMYALAQLRSIFEVLLAVL